MNELYIIDLVFLSFALTAFLIAIVTTIYEYKAGRLTKDFIKRTGLPFFIIIIAFFIILGFLPLLHA